MDSWLIVKLLQKKTQLIQLIVLREMFGQNQEEVRKTLAVNELILNQEDEPGFHRTAQEIS